MEQNSKKERAAMLQMLCCALLWSSSGVLIKLVPWSALVIMGLRSLIAMPVLFAYARIMKYKILFNKKSLLLGLVIASIYFCYLPAVKLTTAANAIVLQYTAPVYVLLFGALFNKKKIRPGDALAVLFAVAGTALFFFDSLGAGSLLGNLLGLLSGAFLGSMFFINEGATQEEHISGTFIGQIIAFVVGLPFVFTTRIEISAPAILYILALGIFQLGLAYIFYARAGKYCSGLTCTLISMIEPLLSPVWVLLFVGEKPGSFALYGGSVVLISITAWYIWNEKQKRATIISNNQEA